MELDFGKGIKTSLTEIYKCIIYTDEQINFAKKSIEQIIDHATNRGFLLQQSDPYFISTHKPSGERFILKLSLQNNVYKLEFNNTYHPDNAAGKSTIEMSGIGELSPAGEITLVEKTK